MVYYGYEGGAAADAQHKVELHRVSGDQALLGHGRVVLDAIKAAVPEAILIPSTGGATGMTPEERLQPTELFPEMATLDCGTCNFGDDIFVNDMPTMRAFGKRMLENNIKPPCPESGFHRPSGRGRG